LWYKILMLFFSNSAGRRRLLTGTVAIVASVASVALLPTPVGADPENPTSERISGADRYGTSAAIALKSCEDLSTPMNIIVASGEGFADALSSAGLAGQLEDAVIMLTRARALPPVIADALAEIENDCGIKSISVIGGANAVSSGVVNELGAFGTVNRVFGSNRYETAVEVAKLVDAANSTVLLATGTSFPDALSAGALAYLAPLPLLLNQGSTLLPVVANYLEDKSITDVIITGGTSAVPQSVEDQLIALGYGVTRIGGADRYETAALLYLYVLSFDTPQPGVTFGVVITDGTNFPDALSAAPFAGQMPGLTLLVRPNTVPLPAPTLSALVNYSEYINRVVAVGGRAAVSDAVLASAVLAATP
jgi:putative cell wall-binding protein